MIAEIIRRYQVNMLSFKAISFPKMPVNPASITAMCNKRYEFFI